MNLDGINKQLLLTKSRHNQLIRVVWVTLLRPNFASDALTHGSVGKIFHDLLGVVRCDPGQVYQARGS